MTKDQINKQLLEALINLLAVAMGVGGTKSNARQIALAAIYAAGGEPLVDAGTQHEIDALMKPLATGEIILETIDPDLIRMMRDGEFLGFIMRQTTGRWGLFDRNKKPLTKTGYSAPKRALAAFKEMK